MPTTLRAGLSNVELNLEERRMFSKIFFKQGCGQRSRFIGRKDSFVLLRLGVVAIVREERLLCIQFLCAVSG